MKTQIIQLDPEDDQHSAREKLRWAKSPRVVLVWPGRGRTLVRQLDLVLLQRQAQQLGIQLGLLTFDPQASAIAADLGLPVFENIEEVDQKSWTHPGHASVRIDRALHGREASDLATLTPPRPEAGTIPNWLRWLLFGAAASIMLVAIMISIPSARIILDPPVSVRLIGYQIPIGTESTRSGVLPVQTSVVEVNASLRVPTSGETAAPNTYAAGEVQLTNVSTQEVVLPAATRLRVLDAGNFSYETTIPASIPAGEEVSVPIIALQPGPASNLDAGATWALESELGLVVNVQNSAVITGGTLATRKAVSASDQAAAMMAIEVELLQTAQEKIGQSLTAAQILVPGSLRRSRTIASSQDHAVGDIADSLEVTMTLEVEGLIIETTELHQFLEDLVREDIEPGFAYQPESLSIFKFTPLDLGQLEPLQLELEVHASTYSTLDRTALTKALRGIAREEIDQVVHHIAPGFSVHELDTRPAWIPLLPLFQFQFEISLPWEAGA